MTAGIAAVLVLLGGTDAASAATTPEPSPRSTATAPALVAAPLAGGVVDPGDSLAVSIGLTAGATPLAGASVAVSIGTDPLNGRDGLSQWLESPDPARAPVSIGTADLGAVAAQDRSSAVIRVGADDPVLTDRGAGAYPVLATTTIAGRTLLSASVFVVPSDQAPSVAVVVPITAPPISRGLLTRDQLATLTADDGDLTAALTGVQGTDAIIAIDPAILAAIRVLGSAAPPSALTWLARFEALPNQRFALQFGDADPAAQAAAGVEPLLAPTSLAAYIDPAGFTPGPGPTPTPTTGAAADEATLPTLAELVDVDADATVVWPEQLNAAILPSLSVHGALTLTDSSAIAPTAAPLPVHARWGTAHLLVADAALNATLSAAATDADGLTRAATLAQASALRALTVTGDTTLVTLDRDPSRPSLALRAAIDDATGGANPLDLDDLLALPPADVSLVDGAVAQARADAVPALLDAEQQVAQFATVLSDPALLTGPQGAGTLQMLSLEWTGQDDAWTEALRTHAADTQATLHAVDILPPSPIQLVAADAEIPVGIRNDLPFPVTVTLHAHTDDLRLDVAESIEVTVGPQQSARAGLPVKARVGSGTVAVRLSLTSPTGVAIGSSQDLEVNVRADWESIGLVILGILAAGFLLLGAVRTIRRVRRRAPAPGTTTGAPDAATRPDAHDTPAEPR